VTAPRARIYRFGVFQFDADRLELFRSGRQVPLQPQPAQVLTTLVERAGQVVTRDELRRAVWPDDTFVDFDRGLNFCIAQIRAALTDDAHAPRYVRTLPKRGYEFIYPVNATDGTDANGLAEALVRDPRPPTLPRPRGRMRFFAAAAAAGVALALGGAYFLADARRGVPIVAVARFDNETADPRLTPFADALTDTVVERLTSDAVGAYKVIGNAALLRRSREQRDLETIGSSLHVQFIVLGQVQQDDSRIRVLAHLIRVPDQTHVMVSRTDGIAGETLAITDAIARNIAARFGPQIRGSAERPHIFR
jgi:DNA-binding winged helix-turn-helix (wHTH) protein/TolB-like protein